MQETIIDNRHTEDIQEIITRVPSWILRWGIVIFGVVLLMALSISAIIRYPDTIKAPVKFQSTHNPNSVIGLIAISQDNFTKVKLGQKVNISLKIYPQENYGQLKGTISYIPDEPDNRGAFILKVKLDSSGLKQHVQIKDWMAANAEIITQDITVLQRITRNLIKK